jgi:hypothetical protein
MNADVTDVRPNLMAELDELDEIEAKKEQMVEDVAEKEEE